MFFKKETPIVQTLNIEKDKPIYILGDDVLATFLTAKFQENGQQAVLLTPNAPTQGYKALEISLKEEYNLQKKNVTLYKTAHISQEPLLLIIASKINSLRSHLTLMLRNRYPDVPVICFNQISNLESIRPIFGTSFHKAYFSGYLTINGSSIVSCGQHPEIIISEKKEENSSLEKIMSLCGIKISFQEKDRYNFWKNNAAQIIGYLSALPKQHITEIINNEESKKALQLAAQEISLLAKFEKVKISPDEIMRQLFETPHGFYYKRNDSSAIENAAYLEKLYNMLSDKARTYKCKIPQINYFIKRNYDNLLKR